MGLKELYLRGKFIRSLPAGALSLLDSVEEVSHLMPWHFLPFFWLLKPVCIMPKNLIIHKYVSLFAFLSALPFANIYINF